MLKERSLWLETIYFGGKCKNNNKKDMEIYRLFKETIWNLIKIRKASGIDIYMENK